jgi:hypothetical protein
LGFRNSALRRSVSTGSLSYGGFWGIRIRDCGIRNSESENKLCDLGVSAVKSRLTEPFYRRGAEGAEVFVNVHVKVNERQGQAGSGKEAVNVNVEVKGNGGSGKGEGQRGGCGS